MNKRVICVGGEPHVYRRFGTMPFDMSLWNDIHRDFDYFAVKLNILLGFDSSQIRHTYDR